MSQLRFCMTLAPASPLPPTTPVSMRPSPAVSKHVSFHDYISIIPTYATCCQTSQDPCISNFDFENESEFNYAYDRRGEDKVLEWTSPGKLPGVWNEIFALRRELFPSGAYFGDQGGRIGSAFLPQKVWVGPIVAVVGVLHFWPL